MPASVKKETRILLLFLTFAQPALIFVDHIHFQYNGFMYGILILAVEALYRDANIQAAILFAIVLNFKHIYLYQALPFFVYLLGHFCFSREGMSLFFLLLDLFF